MPGAAVGIHAWPRRKCFLWKRELSHTSGPSRILMRSLITNNDRVVFCWSLIWCWADVHLGLSSCCVVGICAGRQGNHEGVILEHFTCYFEQKMNRLWRIIIIQSCLKQCLNCCSIIEKENGRTFFGSVKKLHNTFNSTISSEIISCKLRNNPNKTYIILQLIEISIIWISYFYHYLPVIILKFQFYCTF